MDFRFRAHLLDIDLHGRFFAQTALADLDGDGRPEYVVGLREGDIYWYKYHEPNRWTKHLLGRNSPSAVGACVLDVDGDGRLELVAGGGWYRAPGDPTLEWERRLFDPELKGVHDQLAADVDGDGRPEIVIMSDHCPIRWYQIPGDPTSPWPCHDIGEPVHAGLAVGDLDGDGDVDLVRTDIWFENVHGDGSVWAEHPIGPCSPPPPDFNPDWAHNATRCLVRDVDQDGTPDLVYTDAEIPGGKVWWMQNRGGDGRDWVRHEIPNGDSRRRGAYHSLVAGDFDGDGDVDVFSCEMEAVGGGHPPRWYLWENVDGRGGEWREHVILDANLGGHEAVVGDVTGNGLLDIIAKPWDPHPNNALGGRGYVVFLENVSE